MNSIPNLGFYLCWDRKMRPQVGLPDLGTPGLTLWMNS